MTSINIYAEGISEEIQRLIIAVRMLLPAAIFVYLKKFIGSIQWMVLLVSFIAGLIICAYMGRRGATATGILYLMMLWILYTTKGKGEKKMFTFVIGILIISISYLFVIENSNSFFSYIFERGMDDNRSARNEDVITDLNMKQDWLLGRGWFGTYYDSVYGERNVIETGALQLVLRGGLLYCVPYVLILFFTFFYGVFRSNNLFCKSFGMVAVIQIIYLYPYGVPMFKIEYFLLWLGVLICNDRTIRKYNDEEILLKYFNH